MTGSACDAEDVLDQPGAEAASVLGVSVGALKSLLQRARARLEQQTVADEDLAEPTDERARLVLNRYMAAFEQSDTGAIERLLADDAVLEMTGTATWFSGKTNCVPFIATQAIGRVGDWRMVPSTPTASWLSRPTTSATAAPTARSRSSSSARP